MASTTWGYFPRDIWLVVTSYPALLTSLSLLSRSFRTLVLSQSDRWVEHVIRKRAERIVVTDEPHRLSPGFRDELYDGVCFRTYLEGHMYPFTPYKTVHFHPGIPAREWLTRLHFAVAKTILCTQYPTCPVLLPLAKYVQTFYTPYLAYNAANHLSQILAATLPPGQLFHQACTKVLGSNEQGKVRLTLPNHSWLVGTYLPVDSDVWKAVTVLYATYPFSHCTDAKWTHDLYPDPNVHKLKYNSYAVRNILMETGASEGEGELEDTTAKVVGEWMDKQRKQVVRPAVTRKKRRTKRK